MFTYLRLGNRFCDNVDGILAGGSVLFPLSDHCPINVRRSLTPEQNCFVSKYLCSEKYKFSST